ncbi:efflux RND transporter periplasmic adaptor subunit [Roseobacter sp. YSTF-M11]|uniref:Efflux RND transporter periplasmic adaptor subunit n=1 Tax=Roseobacter insulae TaxID=2859783 RepID=A0A9X1FYG0_9RHOB|nr:efflux RND transporter periplasmic adaptor subunit [Roseobacter insulae]MBW4710465.1 efflux RND transporter periplasmic adaptor subunit [Roseobacter insulae]
MPRVVIFLAAALLATSAHITPASAQGADVTDLDPSGQIVPLPSVKILAPEDLTSGITRRFFGRIAARETVDLSFEVGGRLVMLPVVEGETIPQGSVVAALDTENFERAVARAELTLEQTRRESRRAEQLAQSNVTSAVRAEDAATARDLAEVALRDARDDLEDATLRTPFTALVAERIAANFTNVSPGQPILRLHDMSEIRVQIDVPERLFLSGIPPEAVRFTGSVPQAAGPIPLQLAEYEAQTEAIGQTFLVSLTLPDSNIPNLIPGASMTVTATVDVDYAQPGRALPATALLLGEDRTASVMIFEPDGGAADRGTVHVRPVELLSLAGTDLRVTGLAKDALVVGAGVHLLRDGQKVRRYTGLSVEE